MKVTISLTVDARLAHDIKVFYGKAMECSELAAAEHPQTMQLLAKAARAIESEAGLVRPDRAEVGA